MPDITIPDELARMLRARRVIPFVGAGFSTCLGLPGWSDLLRKVASDLRASESEPILDYDVISKEADRDFLRIAEYLYIRAGSNIGPLRLSMTTALQTEMDVLNSTAHVELVNLGAPQVYTTNFDALIERTYRALGQSVDVVALSRDVALADANQTQVVKYHGDLQYDETLVVTESQYYTRLDFESPMDLKFRSDLLGRSVLFVGYSFSDINIRIIWFKLMQMMQDVPKEDRPRSYIVRLQPNRVLEALFSDVGVQTIVLDPESEAVTVEDQTALLGQFMTRLAAVASTQGVIPGTSVRMFASGGLIDSITKNIEDSSGRAPEVDPMGDLPILLERQVPATLLGQARKLLRAVAELQRVELFLLVPNIDRIINWAKELWGATPEATEIAARALMTNYGRRWLLAPKANVDWAVLWGAKLSSDVATSLLDATERELVFHESNRFFDDDLAFGIDLVSRIASSLSDDKQVRKAARELLHRASQLYPAVAKYKPPKVGPPALDLIKAEIDSRGDADET
jgi:hypothetical protein